jgi:hypothetical protein
MPISQKPGTKPPQVKSEQSADAFVNGAGQVPAKKGGRPAKDRKKPVTFTVEVDLLQAFDARAEEAGLSRAALLSLAMNRIVRGEL